MQYAGKVEGRTQSSLMDVCFRFTKSVLMSQLDQLKILILDAEGVLVMHRQLMKDLVLKSNLLIANLMQLTSLPILVNVIVQMLVKSLPLLKDATMNGENLEKCYLCLTVKQFL